MERNNYSALAFRSAAVFIILFQIRLIAADLADTPVFIFTLLAGFAAAAFLSVFKTEGKQIKAIAAVISIGLIPWVGRLLVAMPRIFIPDRTDTPAIIIDSMLLNLDRNNFVSLFPYYWSAVTTFFSVRSRKFLRAAVIADASLLLFIFSVAHTGKIEIYRWPIVMIVLFASVVFLQALALLFSMPSEIKLRVKEKCFAVAALLVIIITGGSLFIKPIQEQAAQMGGGLLEPKFFSFDFTKLLKLDPEISVKNDLILIVKKENDDHILLRRSVLSGYSRKYGFYKIEEIDEKTHPQKLPGGQVFLTPPVFKNARSSIQEYFLVNVENTTFIGMKEPVQIIPYENWDASSFKAAYAVNSFVSDADIHNLNMSTLNWPSVSDLGLSEDELKIYTEYENDEKIRALAEEITDGCISYTSKVIAVYNYLKYGDYRYSLKPGIAPDGDQLGWFLFRSKKGYCSYYAFAMTLLLRSLGIPSRLAAGFFIDQETNTFDYYPVRSDMAHAWVETAFPEYGWIEFDPTTENLAEDEEFQFSPGTDPALFEKLIREILENRFNMKAKENVDDSLSFSGNNSFTQNAYIFLRNNPLPLFAFILIVLSLYIRCGLYLSVFITRNPRKKSVRLMKHARRLLRLAGLRRESEISEPEWALQLDSRYNGIYSLYQSAAAARFAPEYSKQDFNLQLVNYQNFCSSYRANVPLWRRITAWIFPASVILSGRLLIVFLLLGIIAGSQSEAQDANSGAQENIISADALFREASEADYSEHWERAIQLYREGSKNFPDDARFPLALGNLYYGRSLFGLAWDEYRKTERLVPYNTSVLIRLARTAGYLNRYAESAGLYERILEIEPDNMEAIGRLGWMYFKVHRLADGEKLLVSAIDRLGWNSDFLMTLGTIYADMYRYDDSKYWYNKSIQLGEEYSDNEYTAIVWYNLSILESSFYRYELCMDAVNSSLRMHNRAFGHLARGRLLKHQLKLTETQKEYETAYEIDTSPLAKLGLAQVYQISGRLEEARLYAQDCLKDSNNSWMLNFGIDPDRYKRDIHLTLARTYSGLLNIEQFLPWATPKEKILSLLRAASYALKKEVNLKLYRKYSLASANAYGKTFSGVGAVNSANSDAHLDSLTHYYNAFRDYPRRAFTYLNKARTFETTLIPAAIPFYDLKEGVLFDKKHLIEKAMREFDPFWEKEFIADCYKAFKNAEELFAMNRGAVNQTGMKLPIHIDLFFEEPAGSEAENSNKHLERALLKAGFKKESIIARFRLAVRIHGAQESGYTAFCELVDTKGEAETLRYSFPLREITRVGYYELAMSLRNRIFTVD